MDGPTDADAAAESPPSPAMSQERAPEPGEPRRRLARAPAERYLEQERRRAAATGPDASPLVRGGLIALAGSAVMTILGGPLSVTLGLLAVAAFVGWLVGRVVRPAAWTAVGLSVGSVAIGLVGIWLFAGLVGGVLGLFDYLAQVHGLLAPILLAVAGVVAFATIR